jgi:hypothetical protein
MTGIIRRWKRHLTEERLFDCYLADRSGEGVDPPAAEHLADCRECHGHYAELTRFMDEMWIAADTETSAIFTPDRLHVQQQEIARRLELLGHSGRVLTFRSTADNPESVARLEKGPRHLAPAVSRATAGWIAAAAAAGLFIGVSAGMLYDGRSYGATPAGTVMSQPPVSPQPVQADTPAAEQDDDDSTFFLELEAALDRPRTPELMALDAMTPRAREISYRVR